jgi:hypothetical protein
LLAENADYDVHLQLLVAAIGLFVNVRSFSVNWKDQVSCGDLAAKLLPGAWETFGNRLEFLSIQMPLMQVEVLKQSKLRTARLKELSLHLHAIGLRRHDNFVVRDCDTEYVGKAFSSSWETLRVLRLKFGVGATVTGLPSLLSSFRRCPNLTEVEFLPNWDDSEVALEIWGFLRRNNTSLESAIFRVRPGEWGSDTGVSLAQGLKEFTSAESKVFSNIRRLAMDSSRSASAWITMKTLLESCSATLTNLEINHRALSQSDLAELTDIFSSGTTRYPLKLLFVMVKLLTPNVFVQLSKITYLEELILAFARIADDEGKATKVRLKVCDEGINLTCSNRTPF